MSAYPQFIGGPLDGNDKFPVFMPGKPFGYVDGDTKGVYRPDGAIDGREVYKWDKSGRFLENGKMIPVFQVTS